MRTTKIAMLVLAALAAGSAAYAKKPPPASPPPPGLTGSSSGTALSVNESIVAYADAPHGEAPTINAYKTAFAWHESPVAEARAVWAKADRGIYLGIEYAKAESGAEYFNLLGLVEGDGIRSGAALGCGFGASSKYTQFAGVRVGTIVFQHGVPANTFLTVGTTRVTLNEQFWDGTRFAVTGVHVEDEGLDIRVAHAEATLPNCPQEPDPPK